MQWVPAPDTDISPDLTDAPRYLTLEEIMQVVNSLPAVPAAEPLAGKIARQNLAEWLYGQLREVKLCPSAIPELITLTIESHVKSLAEPGTAVGITAGESTAASASQATLKSFHRSGAEISQTFGIEALRNLLFTRRKLNVVNSTIFFKDKTLSFEDVVMKRATIVGSSIADFISKDPNRDYLLDEVTNVERYWWHDVYIAITGKVVPTNISLMLRLYLDLDELYAHKVTIEQIATIIEKEAPPSLIAVCSPMGFNSGTDEEPRIEAMIDLYPNPNIIRKTIESKTFIDPDIAEQIYLKCFVLPQLEHIRVKGISGIKRLIPRVAPVLQVYLDERSALRSDFDENFADLSEIFHRVKLLFFDESHMVMTGIEVENLAALIDAAGVRVYGKRDDHLVVIMPEGAPEDETVNMRIIRMIEEEKQNNTDHSPILAASEFIYAETDGSNLSEVLGHPDVDPDRSFCNNIHEITETLGVEASRALFVKALTETIENSQSYVNPRHISFIADFVHSRGRPLGVTFSSLSRLGGGFFSLATVERAGSVLSQAALYGDKETIANTSTAIAAGQTVALGTGLPQIDPSIEIMKDFERRMSDIEAGRSGPDQVTIGVSAFEAGADDLDDLDMLPSIDDTEREDNVNMSTVFSGAEVIPDYSTTLQTAPAPKVTRTDNPAVAPTKRIFPAPIVSDQLTSALRGLTTLRTMPGDQGGQERLTIQPLATGLAPPSLMEEPPEETEFEPVIVGSGLPPELLLMMSAIEIAAPTLTVTPPSAPPGLPRLEVPTLPPLIGAEMAEMLRKQRRREPSSLTPVIDLDDFLQGLS